MTLVVDRQSRPLPATRCVTCGAGPCRTYRMHAPWWAPSLLGRFRWFRRLAGGRWECWYIDHPVCADFWFRVGWDYDDGCRPPLARGGPRIEDYTLPRARVVR